MRKTGGASIGAKYFLDYYKIDHSEKTRKFELSFDKEHDLYVIDLNKELGESEDK